ncbi:MAG: pyrroloquinoline quinone biosynthesis protein PqqB [Pseudohongiellaceae bacterium]|jgi:pyrroloquinoline quinone biosynthesis protein B
MLTRILATCLLATLAVVASAQEDPFIYILGVVQDAGYPQAGCYRPHCMPGWEDARLARGATSIAVVDPRASRKYLFEATPDLPRQLYDLNQVAPDSSYQLAGVFLTHAHIGHYTGLMHFGREVMGTTGVNVFAMPRMREYLSTNGPWSQLVELNNIRLRRLQNFQTEPLGAIMVTPLLVPHRDEFSETVGYIILGPSRSALFIPDINKWELWDRNIHDEIRNVDYAFVDATFFDGDELPGRDMSEIPHPFVVESMALFAPLPETEKRKIWFIHMNHSNPLLDPDSTAYQTVTGAGFNVAGEGMRFPL